MNQEADDAAPTTGNGVVATSPEAEGREILESPSSQASSGPQEGGFVLDVPPPPMNNSPVVDFPSIPSNSGCVDKNQLPATSTGRPLFLFISWIVILTVSNSAELLTHIYRGVMVNASQYRILQKNVDLLIQHTGMGGTIGQASQRSEALPAIADDNGNSLIPVGSDEEKEKLVDWTSKSKANRDSLVDV